ncbi:hypothetical protein [Ereboglobus luteus]|uniref:Lipoprotein n=1 Tax=Ereboglobus luteus TaxID=1796921 RepID=A0A2U8E3G6_9BACT|nr:hypothetical protein [Ereboglobus luteus]AWI09361.1 hypothetical protein CKA38_08995 [Ereboglobus luteus]
MKRNLAQIFSFSSMLAAVAIVAGCASSGSKSGAVEVVRVWPEYRAAESFDRISEYFSDKENTGGQIVLRTRPESREGYYFFTRVKIPADISNARIVIDVIMPTSPDPKIHSLPVPPLRKGTVLLNPGLTGADWPDAKARPTAWRMRLLAADGAEIFARQSYLWSK